MEVKNIKKILTAIGNPILNNQLKMENNLEVINNDIQYQEGIIETLEVRSEIDFIIISQLLPGDIELEKLVEKIQNINPKIKIILILENYNNNLENILMNQGVYKIYYNNKVEITDIVKIIDKDDKIEKYNEEIRKEIDELKKYINNKKEYDENTYEKNRYNNTEMVKSSKIKNVFNSLDEILRNKKTNKTSKLKSNNTNNKTLNRTIKNNTLNKININKNNIYKNPFINNILKNKNNKIISILGNNGSGKSIFSILLAMSLKKYCKKILIIDFDILNNSLHTIMGVKKYPNKIKKNIEEGKESFVGTNVEDLIININSKIDLISGINLLFDSKNKISKEKLNIIIKKLSDIYDVIVVDTSSECFFEHTKEIIKLSSQSIFLTEANLSEVSKSKRLLEIYNLNWNIEKSKINIIFNKFTTKSIDISILEKLYMDYNIIGFIKLKKDCNSLINKNIKNIKFKHNIFKESILNNILLKKYNKIKKHNQINVGEKIKINYGIGN